MLLLLLSVSLALLAAVIPCRTRLTLREHESDKLLLSLPVDEGERFAIRYTHSVNLSDVTDTLEWTGSELILRSSLFTAFGAGIPVLADGIGSSMENTDEGFLITGIDRIQPENCIPLMLQEVPRHRLLYRGGEYGLRELSPGEPFVKIGIERLPLITLTQ